MPAKIRDLAQAVADAITAATLSQEVTAVRRARVDLELRDVQDLQVSVVPGKWDRTIKRDGKTEKPIVQVAVQKKVNPDKNAEVDPLIDLVEEIMDLFAGTDSTGIIVQDSTNRRYHNTRQTMIEGSEPGYAPSHLDDPRAFTGVAELEFTYLGN